MPRHPARFDQDGIELKFCTKCAEWKPKTDEFFYFRSSRNSWESPCRKCNRAYSKQYNAENPVDMEKQWGYAIKWRYGLTVEAYNEMLSVQNGVCAVCHKPESGKRKRLIVDHCHITGLVRGLLCYKCNTAAGMLGDNPDMATSLANYLQRG